MLGDIKSHRLMILKAFSFVILGFVAITIALWLFPSWQLALLMMVTIWTFCRAYYFCFYVIEKYIDPGYRFDGLISACLWIRNHPGKPDQSMSDAVDEHAQ